mmetsp:Transcript_63428/g.183788  ORF Transcript_63428/g.183788 Transcript_63428/m.183788 type:complete len:210 (+) Transcript_63428:1129-1758(+)
MLIHEPDVLLADEPQIGTQGVVQADVAPELAHRQGDAVRKPRRPKLEGLSVLLHAFARSSRCPERMDVGESFLDRLYDLGMACFRHTVREALHLGSHVGEGNPVDGIGFHLDLGAQPLLHRFDPSSHGVLVVLVPHDIDQRGHDLWMQCRCILATRPTCPSRCPLAAVSAYHEKPRKVTEALGCSRTQLGIAQSFEEHVELFLRLWALR